MSTCENAVDTQALHGQTKAGVYCMFSFSVEVENIAVSANNVSQVTYDISINAFSVKILVGDTL